MALVGMVDDRMAVYLISDDNRDDQINSRKRTVVVFQRPEEEFSTLRNDVDFLRSQVQLLGVGLDSAHSLILGHGRRIAALEEGQEPPDTGEPNFPSGLVPRPPDYEATQETVALWDWRRGTKIDDPNETRPDQQVVSANNTVARWEPLPGDPKNTEFCYTKIIDTADGGKAVEFGANDDVVKREQGTAARLFFKQWGFLTRWVDRLFIIDFDFYLPEPFITRQGAGIALGLGVQNKNPGVAWGLNAIRHREEDPLHAVLWNLTGGGDVNPSAPPGVDYLWKAWNNVRYRVLSKYSGGWVEIHINGKRAFYFSGGRTVLAGFGPDLYNVHAVSGTPKMVFGNMRINVVP